MPEPTSVERRRGSVKFSSGINIVLGVWLVIAPAILGYGGISAAAWNDVIVGALIVIFAGVRVTMPGRFEGLSWLNFVFGIWLIVAPFILGYLRAPAVDGSGIIAMWNDIIVGILVLAFAASSGLARAPRRRG